MRGGSDANGSASNKHATPEPHRPLKSPTAWIAWMGVPSDQAVVLDQDLATATCQVFTLEDCSVDGR